MLKKLALLMFLYSCAIFAADLGTAENPILIESEEDLVLLRDAVNSGSDSLKNVYISAGAPNVYFKLARDLNLSTICGSEKGNWEPIGTKTHPFKGNFDGNGKTIDYLYINEEMPAREAMNTDPFGLFGYVESEQSSSITIANLTIGANSIIRVQSNGITGAVIGWANNNVVISNCVNKAEVVGRLVAGGIVGSATNPLLPDGVNIKDCVNEGYVNSSVGKAGGIVGLANGFGVHLDRCMNTGSVAASDTAAGIVAHLSGAISTSAKLNELINKGFVSSGKISGGIVAVVGEPKFSIANSFNSGRVQASNVAGGIIGHLNILNGPNVSTCVNAGDIFAGSIAGGIVGFQGAKGIGLSGSLTQSLNIATVASALYAGGIVGQNDYAYLNVDHSMNVGVISFSKAGGIAGYFTGSADSAFANLSVSASDSIAIFDDVMAYIEEDCIYPTSKKKAYRTADLVSGAKINVLGDSLWIYRKGYYPQIKSLVNNVVNEIREAQALAATPIFLSNKDKVQSITGNIQTTTKDPQDVEVNVESKLGLFSLISATSIAPNKLGTDTLLISNGELLRKIIVQVKSIPKFGTYDNPLTIASVDELMQFKKALEDASEYEGVKLVNYGEGLSFRIIKDLDLSSVCSPEKGSWDPINSFSGNLDGAKHKISNLYMGDDLDEDNRVIGLFSGMYSKDTAIIENIIMDKVVIQRKNTSQVGALIGGAGGNHLIIRNNSFSGVISAEKCVGGLIGSGGSTSLELLNNIVEGEITSSKPDSDANGIGWGTGGIIGQSGAKSVISGNINKAKVTVGARDGGGIIGLLMNGSCVVENNINEGTIVAATSSDLGGLFGRVESCDKFENNHNKGDIFVENQNAIIGGVAGYMSATKNGYAKNFSNEGQIVFDKNSYGKYIAGGIIGYASLNHVSGFINKGDIKLNVSGKGEAYIGGVFGKFYSASKSDSVVIDSVVNKGHVEINPDTVFSNGQIGGIASSIDTKSFITIRNSINEGVVDVSDGNIEEGYSNTIYVGGISGTLDVDTAYFVNDFNYATINTYANTGITGGLAGIFNTTATIQIENCGNEGNINAIKDTTWSSSVTVAGLFGMTNSINMKDSYNTGYLNIKDKSNGKFYRSSESLSGSDYIGGLIGRLESYTEKNNSSNIRNVVNIGNIDFTDAAGNGTASSDIGGIVGISTNQSLVIENTANYGAIHVYNVCLMAIVGEIVGHAPFQTNLKNVISGGSLVADIANENTFYNSLMNAGVDKFIYVDQATPSQVNGALSYGGILTKENAYNPIAAEGVVVDKQLSILDTNSNYAKYSTAELTADSLPASLSASDWVKVKGFYPQLKTLAESKNEKIRKISALGATPINLVATNRIDSVAQKFKLSNKNALGALATWNADVPQVTVLNHIVSFKNLERDTLVTLTVKSDSITKIVVLHLVPNENPDVWNSKDTLNLSDVTWTSKNVFDYDGKEKSVSLEFVPEAITVVYIDAVKTEIGKYKAKAMLKYDTALYVVEGFRDSVFEWEICEKLIFADSRTPMLTNRVNLVRQGLRTWALEFAQMIPANAKISVVNAFGKTIPVKSLYGDRQILLQDIPQGVHFVRLKAPGLSKTFRISIK